LRAFGVDRVFSSSARILGKAFRVDRRLDAHNSNTLPKSACFLLCYSTEIEFSSAILKRLGGKFLIAERLQMDVGAVAARRSCSGDWR